MRPGGNAGGRTSPSRDRSALDPPVGGGRGQSGPPCGTGRLPRPVTRPGAEVRAATAASRYGTPAVVLGPLRALAPAPGPARRLARADLGRNPRSSTSIRPMTVQQWAALDAAPGPRLRAAGGPRPGVKVAALPGSLGLSVMGRPSTGKGRRTSSPSGVHARPGRASVWALGRRARFDAVGDRSNKKARDMPRPGSTPYRVAVVLAGPRLTPKRLTEPLGRGPARMVEERRWRQIRGAPR